MQCPEIVKHLPIYRPSTARAAYPLRKAIYQRYKSNDMRFSYADSVVFHKEQL